MAHNAKLLCTKTLQAISAIRAYSTDEKIHFFMKVYQQVSYITSPFNLTFSKAFIINATSQHWA